MIYGSTQSGWQLSQPEMVRVMDHRDVSHRIAYTETSSLDAPAWKPDSLDGLVSDQLANLDIGRGNVSPGYDDLLDPQVAKAEAERLARKLRKDYALWKQGAGPKPDWTARSQEIAALTARVTDSRARSAFALDQDESERDDAGHLLLDEIEKQALKGEMTDTDYASNLRLVAGDAERGQDVRLRATADLHSMQVADFLREVTWGDRYEDDDALVPTADEEHRPNKGGDPLAARLAFQQFQEVEEDRDIQAIEEIGWDTAIERRRYGLALPEAIVRWFQRNASDPKYIREAVSFTEEMGPDGPIYKATSHGYIAGPSPRRVEDEEAVRPRRIDRSVTKTWAPELVAIPRRSRVRPQERPFLAERPAHGEPPKAQPDPKCDDASFWTNVRPGSKASSVRLRVTD